MRLTEPQLLDALARMPFVDTLELAVILGEAYATVHRGLSGLLSDGIHSEDQSQTSTAPGPRASLSLILVELADYVF